MLDITLGILSFISRRNRTTNLKKIFKLAYGGSEHLTFRSRSSKFLVCLAGQRAREKNQSQPRAALIGLSVSLLPALSLFDSTDTQQFCLTLRSRSVSGCKYHQHIQNNAIAHRCECLVNIVSPNHDLCFQSVRTY